MNSGRAEASGRTLPLVWTWSPDGKIAFANTHWSAYTGIDGESAAGLAWDSIVDFSESADFLEEWPRPPLYGEPVAGEAKIRRSDGQYRWFLVQLSSVSDLSRQVVKGCAVATDIHDYRHSEARELAIGEPSTEVDLHGSQSTANSADDANYSRLIVDSIPGMICVFTAAGAVEFVSKQVLEFFGSTQEDQKRWASNGAVHPDDIDRATAAFSRAVATGSPFEMEVRARRANGTYSWVQSRGLPLRDAQGNIVRWYNLLVDIDEQKRAEAAMRDTETRLRKIIDTIPALAWAANSDGSAKVCNQRYVDYTGLAIENLQGWGYLSAVHPDDLAALQAMREGIALFGEPVEVEARLRRFDGQYRWFLIRGTPLRDSDGNILEWYGFNIDIEDRKIAEQAVAASENNLKLTIDAIPAMAWSARTDGTAEFFNRRYLDYVGQPAEELKDWGWTVAVHPDDLDRLASVWGEIIATGKAGECEARMRRFDGEARWFLFRVNPLYDAAGNIVRWYGTNTDIDDLKRLQNDLRRSEAFLAEGQHLAKIGNFSWHVNANAINWSEPLYSIYEIDPDVEITLGLIAERVHPDDLPLLADMGERANRAESDFEYQHRIFMADGSIKFLHIVGHRVSGPDSPTEYVGAVLDVTQQRQSEEALEKIRSELAQVTRVMSLGVLTASIAHEVNQPLAGIVTNASTCLRMLAADPPNIELAQETARRTIRDGHKAADVIAKLRSLFTGRADTFEPIDLNDAVQDVIGLARGDIRRCNAVLRTEFESGLPLVNGDRVQLQQVILNLLRNAMDAMSDVSGRERALCIRTETVEGGNVRFSVKDTGVGFESDSDQRIFDAFYTTKVNGMGIGLSVSRAIIERHSGTLRASSNDGPGVTVYFSIPRWLGS